MSFSSIRCFSTGNSVITRCKNKDVSSSRRSGDSTPFTTMLRAIVCNSASSSTESSRPVNTTTGTSDSVLSLRMLSSTSKPLMSGSRRSSTTQSHGFSRKHGKRFRAGAGRDDLDVVMTQQLLDAHLLRRVVLHNQQALAAGFCVLLDLG